MKSGFGHSAYEIFILHESSSSVSGAHFLCIIHWLQKGLQACALSTVSREGRAVLDAVSS